MPKYHNGFFLPKGVILIWSGAEADIPQGFVLCDGNNGTPDLRNNFVIGAGDTYSVDDTGGDTEHNHGGVTGNYGHSKVFGGGTNWGASGISFHGHTISTDNHLPPYYALCYIMKT